MKKAAPHAMPSTFQGFGSSTEALSKLVRRWAYLSVINPIRSIRIRRDGKLVPLCLVKVIDVQALGVELLMLSAVVSLFAQEVLP
jgi:hypothetical protein